MPAYKYKAISPRGERREGVIEASNPDAARELIHLTGDIPASVERVRASELKVEPKFSAATVTLKPQVLILFSKQLATMIKGGVSYPDALKTLLEQSDSPALRYICQSLFDSLSKGEPLSKAMERHPKVFNPIYLGMVQAGEASGELPQVLHRLVRMIEDNQKIRQEIISALTYPLIVICALVGAFIVLITVVVPQFSGIFAKAEMQLPLPTLICIQLNELITHYWYLGLGGAGALYYGYRVFVSRPQGRLWLDRLWLRIPFLGEVVCAAAIARFCSVLAIFQSSGVVVHDALKLIVGALGNLALSAEMNQVSERIASGESIAGALAKSPLYPKLLVNMVRVGEEAGTLAEVLEETAKHYETEMRLSIKKFMDIINPALVFALMLMVLFFALAIYMPLWELGKTAR